MRELDPNVASANTLVDQSDNMVADGLLSVPSVRIDTSLRYDIYSNDAGQRVKIYRNVSIRGLRKFPIDDSDDSGIDFIEMEQSNGQNIYLSARTVFKFCEHGTDIDGEIDPSS